MNICALAAMSSALILGSCTPNLESESGLYDDNIKLVHTYKIAVDGFWITDKESSYAGQKKGFIYVSPLDTKLIEEDYAEYCEPLQKEMHASMVKELNLALKERNAKSKTDWRVTENPKQADVIIDIAVVRLSSQNWVLKALNSTLGWFIPIPGVSTAVGYLAEGSIGIEVITRDAKTGAIGLVIKDSNRKKTRIYNKNAYSETGHVTENFDYWAKSISNVIRTVKFDKEGRNNLQKLIDGRSMGDVISKRAASNF